MTVKEFALNQLHWIIRRDPWVQEIFTAAGVTLDEMAERIIAIWNFDDFSKLTEEQVLYYETLLGLTTDGSVPLADRRAAVQATWNGGQRPSLESIQAICDSWEAGGVDASYSDGELTLVFQGSLGVPANLSTLQAAISTIVPAHIVINYSFLYLLIQDLHEVKTLTEMDSLTLNLFAGG